MDGGLLFGILFMVAWLFGAFYLAALEESCSRLKRDHPAFYGSLGSPSLFRPGLQAKQSLTRAIWNGSLFALRDQSVSRLTGLAIALEFIVPACMLVGSYCCFFADPA